MTCSSLCEQFNDLLGSKQVVFVFLPEPYQFCSLFEHELERLGGKELESHEEEKRVVEGVVLVSYHGGHCDRHENDSSTSNADAEVELGLKQ